VARIRTDHTRGSQAESCDVSIIRCLVAALKARAQTLHCHPPALSPALYLHNDPFNNTLLLNYVLSNSASLIDVYLGLYTPLEDGGGGAGGDSSSGSSSSSS
jgi:hypothetical protein